MFRYLGITLPLLIICLSGCCQSNSDTFFSYFIPSFLKQSSSSSPPSYSIAANEETECTGCSQKITLIEDEQSNTIQEVDQHASFSDSVVTSLRIEYIKNQILNKLRLKEKPAVSLDNLPRIVKENDYIMSKIRDEDDDDDEDGYSDDFYAKTTRVIVFPYEGTYTHT